MKRKDFSNKIIVFIYLLFINCGFSYSQKKGDPQFIPDRAIAIIMTFHKFNKLVLSLTKQTNDSLIERNTDYYIQYVRCINTIEEYYLGDNYKSFRDIYYKSVLIDGIKKLNAGFYKGGAFYSYKYNLFFGGPRHKNSQYYLIWCKCRKKNH